MTGHQKDPTPSDRNEDEVGEQAIDKPSRTSPYPVSRLAPKYDLVDVAKAIQHADHMLGTVTHHKLDLIAEQIRGLQEKAKEILASAERDATLHRAVCAFEKKPGREYHLYRRASSEEYWSMLSPEDWGDSLLDEYCGSFVLLADMSWKEV